MTPQTGTTARPQNALPAGVHIKNGRYYLVRSSEGKRKWIGLSIVADGDTRLKEDLAALERGAVITIGELLRVYLREGTDEIKAVTRKGYTGMCADNSPLMGTFGRMRITSLTTLDVAKYLEKRKREGRAHGGNRERAVLSAAYEFGMRNGYATANPCRGVRRNRETPRKRYVTTAELQAAVNRAPVQFGELLFAAYLTGLRQADLLALRVSDLHKDGIRLIESKTGRARHIEWSAELRKIVNAAMVRAAALAKRLGHPPPTHVFTGRYGAPWTQWAVQSQMRRLNVDWHFHDLRAKAATDASHSVLGKHSTLGTYLRGERTRPTV